MLRTHAGDGKSRCRSGTLRLRLRECGVHPQRRSVGQLEARRRQTPIAHWYRESLPVFRFNVFELRLDHPFDSTVFTVEMLQAAGQEHPRLLLSAHAIYACDLLRQRLLDQLLERAALPCRDGFCFAEEWPRNFECRFHKATVSPIFMGTSKPRRRNRVKHRSASRVLVSLIRSEAIFPETLMIFFLCKEAMKHKSTAGHDLHGGKPRKAKTMKGNNTYENKIS